MKPEDEPLVVLFRQDEITAAKKAVLERDAKKVFAALKDMGFYQGVQALGNALMMAYANQGQGTVERAAIRTALEGMLGCIERNDS